MNQEELDAKFIDELSDAELADQIIKCRIGNAPRGILFCGPPGMERKPDSNLFTPVICRDR